MKIAVAQIDTTIGDFEGNAEKILARLKWAEDSGADLAVFPELAVCGYPPRDLLEKPWFVKRNLECVERIASKTGSGLITMPGPPPYGRSSTVRWRSVANSRKSTVDTSSAPFSRAMPTMLSSRKASNRRGKRVRTWTFTARRLGSGGRCRDADTETLDQYYGDHTEIMTGRSCTTPFRMMMVKTDGSVIPSHARCFDFPVGKLGDQSLAEIWNGEALRSFRMAISDNGGHFLSCSRCGGLIATPFS